MLRISAVTPTQTVVTFDVYLVSRDGLKLFLENQDFVEMCNAFSKLFSNIAIPQN